MFQLELKVCGVSVIDILHDIFQELGIHSFDFLQKAVFLNGKFCAVF